MAEKGMDQNLIKWVGMEDKGEQTPKEMMPEKMVIKTVEKVV